MMDTPASLPRKSGGLFCQPFQYQRYTKWRQQVDIRFSLINLWQARLLCAVPAERAAGINARSDPAPLSIRKLVRG